MFLCGLRLHFYHLHVPRNVLQYRDSRAQKRFFFVENHENSGTQKNAKNLQIYENTLNGTLPEWEVLTPRNFSMNLYVWAMTIALTRTLKVIP